jgi:hypothetical protein
LSLLIEDKSPTGPSAGDKVVWKWLKGPRQAQSDYGDPTTGSTSYRLCLYASGVLVTQLTLPGDDALGVGSCGGNGCWRRVGTSGYKYDDPTLRNDGFSKVILNAGHTGSSIILMAEDGNVPVPALPLDVSAGVTLQLHRSDRAAPCWEARYPAPARSNDGVVYKDKVP